MGPRLRRSRDYVVDRSGGARGLLCIDFVRLAPALRADARFSSDGTLVVQEEGRLGQLEERKIWSG